MFHRTSETLIQPPPSEATLEQTTDDGYEIDLDDLLTEEDEFEEEDSYLADEDDQFGDYLRLIGNFTALGTEEVVTLITQIKSGQDAEKALTTLVEHNLKLVIGWAHRYERDGGVPLMDLIQQGNLGILEAINRYQPSKGKFSTYASWWIRKYVSSSIPEQGRALVINKHAFDRTLKVQSTYYRLQETLGRPPTYQEVADELGIGINSVRNYLLFYQVSDHASLSAYHQHDDDYDNIPADYVADPLAITGEHFALQNERLAMLQRIVEQAHLTPQEQTVLFYLTGIEWLPAITQPIAYVDLFNEVAKITGLSHKEIRRLKKSAMTKMRIYATKNTHEDFRSYFFE